MMVINIFRVTCMCPRQFLVNDSKFHNKNKNKNIQSTCFCNTGRPNSSFIS